MDEATKLKLKQMGRTKCTICKSPQNYRNPVAKCDNCGKKFCFLHITGGVWIKGQLVNEEFRDICDTCLPKIIRN